MRKAPVVALQNPGKVCALVKVPQVGAFVDLASRDEGNVVVAAQLLGAGVDGKDQRWGPRQHGGDVPVDPAADAQPLPGHELYPGVGAGEAHRVAAANLRVAAPGGVKAGVIHAPAILVVDRQAVVQHGHLLHPLEQQAVAGELIFGDLHEAEQAFRLLLAVVDADGRVGVEGLWLRGDEARAPGIHRGTADHREVALGGIAQPFQVFPGQLAPQAEQRGVVQHRVHEGPGAVVEGKALLDVRGAVRLQAHAHDHAGDLQPAHEGGEVAHQVEPHPEVVGHRQHDAFAFGVDSLDVRVGEVAQVQKAAFKFGAVGHHRAIGPVLEQQVARIGGEQVLPEHAVHRRPVQGRHARVDEYLAHGW